MVNRYTICEECSAPLANQSVPLCPNCREKCKACGSEIQTRQESEKELCTACQIDEFKMRKGTR